MLERNPARLGGPQQRPGGQVGHREEQGRGHGHLLAGNALHVDWGAHGATLQLGQRGRGPEEEGEVQAGPLAEGSQTLYQVVPGRHQMF